MRPAPSSRWMSGALRRPTPCRLSISSRCTTTGASSSGPSRRERMVGFVCGFSGWDRGRVFHHSHMLGVLAGLPRVGARREAQVGAAGARARAGHRARQLDLRPSPGGEREPEREPARGASSGSTASISMARARASSMEAFPPIDSKPSGCVSSERVTKALRGELPGWPSWERLPRANATAKASVGLSGLGESRSSRSTRTPSSRRSRKASTEIMAEDMELALDWRLKTRELFGAYFERGYAVKGFHRLEDGAFYRLEREETPADLNRNARELEGGRISNAKAQKENSKNKIGSQVRVPHNLLVLGFSSLCSCVPFPSSRPLANTGCRISASPIALDSMLRYAAKGDDVL